MGSETSLERFNLRIKNGEWDDIGAPGDGGTVTSVGFSDGDLIDTTGTNPITKSGTVTINVDLSELSTSTSDADGDYFVVIDAANAQKKLTKANIDISGFNNDSGYGTGTVTSVGITDGNLIDSSGGPITTSGTITLNVDLSELADGTAVIDGSTDEMVYLDSGAQKRKQIDEIYLGQFNNDQGWTSNTGTVTNSNSVTLTNKTISGGSNTLSNISNGSLTNDSLTVTAGTGLSGGGVVELGGSITLNNTEVSSVIGGSIDRGRPHPLLQVLDLAPPHRLYSTLLPTPRLTQMWYQAIQAVYIPWLGGRSTIGSLHS